MPVLAQGPTALLSDAFIDILQTFKQLQSSGHSGVGVLGEEDDEHKQGFELV